MRPAQRPSFAVFLSAALTLSVVVGPGPVFAQEVHPDVQPRVTAAESHLRAGRFPSALGEAHEALAALRVLGEGSDESFVLNLLGRIFGAQNRPDSAQVYFRAGLERAREVGDFRQAGNAALNLGMYAGRVGDMEAALGFALDAREAFHADERLLGTAQAAIVAGETLVYLGRPDSAMALLAAGVDEAVEAGSPDVQARGLGLMGRIHLQANRGQEAEAALAGARRIYSRGGALLQVSEMDMYLSDAFLMLARPDSAEAAARRAVDLAHRSGQPGVIGETEYRLHRVFGYRAQMDSARVHAEVALENFRQARHPAGIARAAAAVGGMMSPTEGTTARALLHEAVVLSGQVGDAETRRQALWSLAGSFLLSELPDSAALYAGEARDAARAMGNVRGEASALQALGSALAALGRGAEAQAAYREALAFYEAVGDQRSVATILTSLGNAAERREEAMELFEESAERARAAGLPHVEAQALYLLGLRLSETDIRGGAVTSARAAVLAEGDPSLQLMTAAGAAMGFQQAGEPDSARVYLELAGSLVDGVGAGDPVGVGGLAPLLNHPDLSPEIRARLQEMLQSSSGSQLQHQRRGAEEGVRAGVQAAVAAGQLDSATVLLESQLRRAREWGDGAVEGRALLGMAQVQGMLGRPDSAQALLAAATVRLGQAGDTTMVRWTEGLLGSSGLPRMRDDLRSALARGDRLGEATARTVLGQYWIAEAQPDSALTHLEIAQVIWAEAGGRPEEAAVYMSLASARSLGGDEPGAREAAQRALQVSRAVGFPAAESAALGLLGAYALMDGDPTVADALLDTASVVMAGLRRDAGDEASRLSMGDRLKPLTDAWIGVQMALVESQQGTVAAGLAAHERGRAQELLELVAGTRDLEPGADLSAEGRALMEKTVPPGTMVLSYWVSSVAEFAAVWAITEGDHIWVELDVGGDELRRMILEYRRVLTGEAQDPGRNVLQTLDAITTRSREVGAASGPPRPEVLGELPDVLLPLPVLDFLLEAEPEELLIVPDGVVGLVPFAGLSLGDASLGEYFPIRYAPSLEILGELRERPVRAAEENPLVVGDPTMPSLAGTADAFTLLPLPGAFLEGQWLAEKTGVSLLTGDDASETVLRRMLPDASLIHLATHGLSYSSEQRERDSFVALAPDGENDGLLTVDDVLRLERDLSAELVVLSACQTGLGNLREAEGTVGLQRAFLAKGARNVLVSLWSVSDEATALLMRHFYDNWLEWGFDKAEALARAQNAVRNTPGFEHPRYWAAFQLVGPG